jgi:dinuclear metal center YbgI/SA1388 family protein
MVLLDDLTARLDGYLAAHDGADWCPNGLQVGGRREVRRVVTGVSASVALLDAAIERGADAVLVHHGVLWHAVTPRVIGSHRQRLQRLLTHDLSLLAYHLPLDRHPEVGTAATVARALGWRDLEPFGDHRGRPTGVIGRVDGEPLNRQLDRVRAALGREPLAFAGGPAAIHRAAVVTGDAFDELSRAVAAGCDLFLTGEPKERAMDLAREEGIHFVAAGHYHTEAPGVRALTAWIAANVDVEAEFVDLPNPV